MRTIGIAGTAKNTGKTTTALEVLRRCSAEDIPVALTSIGYDGENRDNITGLPKPRFHLEAGMVFATAESCLAVSSAPYKRIYRTEIRTALGNVVIAQTSGPGLVLVAGPNRRSELLKLFKLLSETAGARVVLVDGALNRLVPLTGTDGIILATGGALEPDVPRLVRHARALLRIYQPDAITPCRASNGNACLSFRDGSCETNAAGSLLSMEAGQRLAQLIRQPLRELTLPGACDPRALSGLIQERAAQFYGTQLIFGSPLNLMASSSPFEWEALFTQAEALEIQVAYLEKNPLFCLTVNPFYPQYNSQTGAYLPAYLDKVDLLHAMRASILDVPVIDVYQPPFADLLDLCKITPEE